VVDQIVIGNGRPVDFAGGSATAELALVRLADGKPQRIFAAQARGLTIAGAELLRSPRPVDISAKYDARGRLSWVRVATKEPVGLTLQGQPVKLPAGVSVAQADLRFAADPAAAALDTNSLQSQQLLRAGLEPLIRQIVTQRDELAAQGMKNLARDAKVTASATRDPRFPPELVVDNQTWEYPADGRLDYTQGELLTTPLGGYGPEAFPLTGTDESPMSSWPFYIRPTYWLLPYQQRGWIQLELPQETPVKLVRLLNTSNAGANDYATMKFHVELLDARGKVVATQPGQFGQPFDRPFQAAFKIPQAFRKFGDTYRGMLEPGVKVPFGDGWQTVPFPAAPAAKFVKIYIDTYWALGGGLNEIQVY
jgi:hypothetical protein